VQSDGQPATSNYAYHWVIVSTRKLDVINCWYLPSDLRQLYNTKTTTALKAQQWLPLSKIGKVTWLRLIQLATLPKQRHLPSQVEGRQLQNLLLYRSSFLCLQRWWVIHLNLCHLDTHLGLFLH
jgi:hypothetical protein